MTLEPIIDKKAMRVVTYTDIIGPSNDVIGTIEDGGTLVFGSVPGCWGPMITPRMKSGHEVTLPVNVAGAEVGDGLALHIKRIKVQAEATASGTDNGGSIGCFVGDPYVARKCPHCGAEWPETYIDGIGFDSVKCKECDSPAIPFRIVKGYTMAFDEAATVGYTVGHRWAEHMARESLKYSGLERYPKAVSHWVSLPGYTSTFVTVTLKPRGSRWTTPTVSGDSLEGCLPDLKMTDRFNKDSV